MQSIAIKGSENVFQRDKAQSKCKYLLEEVSASCVALELRLVDDLDGDSLACEDVTRDLHDREVSLPDRLAEIVESSDARPRCWLRSRCACWGSP